jgi:hypothetical protein
MAMRAPFSLSLPRWAMAPLVGPTWPILTTLDGWVESMPARRIAQRLGGFCRFHDTPVRPIPAQVHSGLALAQRWRVAVNQQGACRVRSRPYEPRSQAADCRGWFGLDVQACGQVGAPTFWRPAATSVVGRAPPARSRGRAARCIGQRRSGPGSPHVAAGHVAWHRSSPARAAWAPARQPAGTGHARVRHELAHSKVHSSGPAAPAGPHRPVTSTRAALVR